MKKNVFKIIGTAVGNGIKFASSDEGKIKIGATLCTVGACLYGTAFLNAAKTDLLTTIWKK